MGVFSASVGEKKNEYNAIQLSSNYYNSLYMKIPVKLYLNLQVWTHINAHGVFHPIKPSSSYSELPKNSLHQISPKIQKNCWKKNRKLWWREFLGSSE